MRRQGLAASTMIGGAGLSRGSLAQVDDLRRVDVVGLEQRIWYDPHVLAGERRTPASGLRECACCTCKPWAEPVARLGVEPATATLQPKSDGAATVANAVTHEDDGAGRRFERRAR